MRRLIGICLCFFLLFGCTAKRINKEQTLPEIFLNDEQVELEPTVHVLSNDSDGGIWDSSANHLPSLSVENGDKIVFRFEVSPKSVEVRKYDLFSMETVLGSAESRSDPEDVPVFYEKKDISFVLAAGEAESQLILVIADWDETIQYAFTIQMQ